MSRRAICLLAATVVVAALPALATAAGLQLEVQAQPQRLAAGSEEPSAITVRVSDAAGAPAPDGTEITFVTTLGTITPQTAATLGGLARAELRSASPGTAEVSVLVAGQREVVTVEFRGGPAKPAGEIRSEVVKISGKYVAYSAEYDCITATDARAKLGDLVIEAGNLQYEVTRSVLKAQHSVRVRRGEQALEGERAYYSITNRRGVLLRAREGVERVCFCAEDLTPTAEATPEADFTPPDTSDTSTWIVARAAAVVPQERLQFTDARLYVGSKRIFSLPYYVAPLRGQRSLLNQVFSFNSTGGINLDLPLYYSADAVHAGALHIRHRAAGGYGYGTTGWSLGLEEGYRFSPRSTGVLAVDNLTQNTRSLRLDHHLEFTPDRRMDMAVNYYRYSSSYPGALTGRALYCQRLPGADLNVVALGSAISGLSTWSLDGNLRWGGREIGHSGVGYDVTANLGYGGGQLGYGGGVTAGGGLGLAPPEWKISKRTCVTVDLVQQYVWAQIGGLRDTFDARAMLRQGLGQLGSVSLGYSYNLSRGGYYSSYGREQVSLNAFLGQGARWNASGYASYGLDNSSLFASGGVSYHPPIDDSEGVSPWRLDLRGAYTRFGTASSVNSRVAVGRAIGQYEVLVCYSPTASYGYGCYGYGYGSGKTFWIELAAAGL